MIWGFREIWNNIDTKPIVIEYDEYYGFGLTIDTAKEMIKDLQEIVDYMGGEEYESNWYNS